MKAFTIGTIIVIAGALVVPAMIALDASREVAVICGIAVSVIGFVVQMRAAFSTKWKFERELRQAQENHAAVMNAAAKLPPEQAIALLLKNI